MQQQQSWLIQENWIKVTIAQFEMKHWSKTVLCWKWSKTSFTLFLPVILCEKEPFVYFYIKHNRKHTIHRLKPIKCQWYLWSPPEMYMKDNRIGNIWHYPIKFFLYIITEFKLKIYTQLIWEKGLARGLVGAPTMLKLQWNRVIRIRNIVHL